MNILSRIRVSFVLCAAAIAPLFASTSDDNTAYSADSAASKLSSSLHRWLPRHNDRAASAPQDDLRTCAFIEKTDGADSVLLNNDCTILADFGDIVIADVPLSRVSSIASDNRIKRIEAEQGNVLTLDSMALHTDAVPIYEGTGLPQAYTGKDVVVGLMDVGFDTTHPTFYDSDMNPRVKRMWDQIGSTGGGNEMYVGAEYTEEDLWPYGRCSYDSSEQYHGTHTLGIAAGNGGGTKFRGMAPESDICLVSNAVTSDEMYIEDKNLYKYTHATDALGFKYIFDYADSVGKPCVISFSEGSRQTLHDDDRLYYRVLDHLTGPGRIIVVSAGNEGFRNNYVGKPAGRASAGTFMKIWGQQVAFSVTGEKGFALRTILYNVGNDAKASEGVDIADGKAMKVLSAEDVASCKDAMRRDTITVGENTYIQTSYAYRSAFHEDQWAMDVTIDGTGHVGYDYPLSVELTGEGSAAEMFLMNGTMCEDDANPYIADADITHGILSPGSAPAVICVGGTACRPVFTNTKGERIEQSWGVNGERGNYSSVGPTFDGRTKPDVMAPGANVVSLMNHDFTDNTDNPNAKDLKSYTVYKEDVDNIHYEWTALGGTSMSAPAVAGIIALWLQANPSLTPQDVLGVISRTSRSCGDYGEKTPWYCGYGMIDAYSGLLDVLGMTKIEGLSREQSNRWDVRVTPERHLIIYDRTQEGGKATVKVFDTAGRLCRTMTFATVNSPAGTHADISLADMPKGVYAIQIDSEKQPGSALIRL